MAAHLTEEEALNPDIAQTERIGLGDLIIAGVLAVLTLFISTLWEFPGIAPSLWNDACVTSGVRPASTVVPGYLRCLGSIVFSFFSLNVGTAVLKTFGHVTLMAIVISVYASLREVLAFMMRARPQFSSRRTVVMKISAAVGAVAFVCSDAVWSAGMSTSETTLLVLLMIAAIEFYFVFLRKGSLKYAYICSLLLGLLTAESSFGLLLGAIFIGIYGFILKVMPVMESPFFKPAVIAVGKWHMTFLFVGALICGVALNCVTFASHGGLSSIGLTAGDVPLAYLKGYWNSLSSASNVLGWVLWAGAAVSPCVVALLRFPPAADEEQFLSYPTGVVFLACGVIAVMQCCALPALWYWTYAPIHSQFLLTIGSFLSATTLALAVTILGVDALCRNHKRLALQSFGGDDESELAEEESPTGKRTVEFLRLLGLVLVPSVILLAIVPGRDKLHTREMLSIINEAIAATVDEAGDSKYLFTDGNLDSAIEFASAARGRRLHCISLLGGGDPMSVYLRTRDIGNDKEDVFSFRLDAGTGLRTWMRNKPERLAESSLLLGFDLWKRDGKAIPEMGGFLSRPAVEVDPVTRATSVKRAHGLARRIIEIIRRGGFSHCTDRSIVTAVTAIQWRLARMCLYRSENADLAGRVDEAIAEASLAKELNDCNPIYQDLLLTAEKNSELLMSRLTPREGLQLALVRADFTMAKHYAETILVAVPEHPRANFAMGMYYLKQRQLSRAETYLKRCLVGMPKEPAVYNNIAMIQMEQGKFDAALVNVEKALELIPESSAVKDTKKQILERRAEARKGK